jgi:hypothetical protein
MDRNPHGLYPKETRGDQSSEWVGPPPSECPDRQQGEERDCRKRGCRKGLETRMADAPESSSAFRVNPARARLCVAVETRSAVAPMTPFQAIVR